MKLQKLAQLIAAQIPDPGDPKRIQEILKSKVLHPLFGSCEPKRFLIRVAPFQR